MPVKAHVDQISIASPCKADWNLMRGNDEVRFCEHCSLSVHHLSALTRKQISKLIAKSEGRLCVQYVRRPDGLLTTTADRGKLHQIVRGASRIAAGAFSATLSVTGAAQAASQQDTRTGASDVPYNTSPMSVQNRSATTTLSGKVTDQNGAPITSATIGLFQVEAGFALYASTNSSGVYSFDLLAPGSYSIRIEAPGFAPYEMDAIYLQGTGRELSQTLNPPRPETDQEPGEVLLVGGVMAVVAPADPLIRAAQQDDMEEVVRLVAGARINLRDEKSKTTALEHAVRNANRQMVQLFISSGADVNLQNAAGETVLMMLDSDATSDLAWDLINAGAKLNTVDQGGNTPLMEVASGDNVDVLKTLLDAGAQVQTKNKEGQTALMMAAEEGLVNNVRALILAGADINAVDAKGRNALHYACEYDRDAAKRLLQAQGSAVVTAQTQNREQ